MAAESFVAVCWVLIGLYAFIGILAVFQLSLLFQRLLEEQLYQYQSGGMNSSTSTWKARLSYIYPRTIQMKVQWLVLLLSSVRVAFFAVAMRAWDPLTGTVVGDRVTFYGLDEFGTVLFFTLTSVLAVFWAELYYISVDNMPLFSRIIKPLVLWVNIAAYAGVSVCVYLPSTTNFSEDHTDYVYLQYSLLGAGLYLFSAIFFAYFANVSANALQFAPAQLSARLNRLVRLKILAFASIVALTTRALVLLILTGRSFSTHSFLSLSLFLLYYIALEWTPMLIAVWFYLAEDSYESQLFYDALSDDEDEHERTLWESHPLVLPPPPQYSFSLPNPY